MKVKFKSKDEPVEVQILETNPRGWLVKLPEGNQVFIRKKHASKIIEQ